jgi:hypothetical protein
MTGPAMRKTAFLPAILAVCIAVAGDRSPIISTSKDVVWLEKIAGSMAEAQAEAPKLDLNLRAMLGSIQAVSGPNDPYRELMIAMLCAAKRLRTSAYIRLGDLGTDEALAALKRIEDAAKKVPITPEKVAMGIWTHPVARYADNAVRPMVQTNTPNGTTYGIVSASLLGDLDFFLVWTKTTQDAASWSRPVLFPQPIVCWLGQPALTAKDDDHLVFSCIQVEPPPQNLMKGTLDPVPKAPAMGEQKWEISISEVCKDSDKDGWTDIEEKRLGLDPNKADTDGDGIPDGQDVCPDYAPSAVDAGNEDVEIIQKAVFATYGLSGSRYLLLPDSDSRKVQLWGYGGPILYKPDSGQLREDVHSNTLFVHWSIKQKTATEATVSLGDYAGSNWASGQEVFFRKIGQQWVVVKFGIAWVN